MPSITAPSTETATTAIDVVAHSAPPAAAAAAVPDGVRTLVRALESLTRAQREVSAAIARALDLPRSSLSVLRALEICGTSHVGDLAETLRVDISVASRNVSALVDAGLIERTVPDGDRRTRLLSLTRAGRDLGARAQRDIDQLTVESFERWQPADLDDAVAVLLRMTDALGQISSGLGADDAPPPPG